MRVGGTRTPIPVTLGDMEDYIFDVDSEEMRSTLVEGSWNSGKPSGTVQKGYIKDASNPDLLDHHLKSMALSRRIDEMQAQEKRISEVGKGSPGSFGGDKTSREAFVQLLTEKVWNQLSYNGKQYLQRHFRKEESGKNTSPSGKPFAVPAASADATAPKVFSRAYAFWKQNDSLDYKMLKTSTLPEEATEIVKKIDK